MVERLYSDVTADEQLGESEVGFGGLPSTCVDFITPNDVCLVSLFFPLMNPLFPLLIITSPYICSRKPHWDVLSHQVNTSYF